MSIEVEVDGLFFADEETLWVNSVDTIVGENAETGERVVLVTFTCDCPDGHRAVLGFSQDGAAAVAENLLLAATDE